ncbi:MAG: sigma factor-like helix-turn-helix DNA-binding protein [bacterium]
MDDISILDKVLSSKQTADIENFNPTETLSALFRHVSSKEEEVIRRRFGLNGQKPETLEEIGKRYSVTRERIRQIENAAVKKILSLKEFPGIIALAEDLLRQILEAHGGVMTEQNLLDQLFRPSGTSEAEKRIVLFFLRELLCDTFDPLDVETGLRAGWKLKPAALSIVHETIDQIVGVIRKVGTPMLLDGLIEQLRQLPYFQQHTDRLSEDVILSSIDLSPDIAKNPYGEYGLSAWGTIVPKRMNDKIYLILKKNGKPMHFNEITAMINKMGFDHRQAYPPTVHNELILNTEYVLVGRGIYALREWGYKPGVVADVMVEILKNAGEPLSRDDLVNKVLEQRIVKKNTVYLALADRKKFEKLPDGRYQLSKDLRG